MKHLEIIQINTHTAYCKLYFIDNEVLRCVVSIKICTFAKNNKYIIQCPDNKCEASLNGNQLTLTNLALAPVNFIIDSCRISKFNVSERITQKASMLLTHENFKKYSPIIDIENRKLKERMNIIIQ